MDLTNSSSKWTPADGGRSAKNYSVFCHPFPNAYFETLDTNVPYVVNAALNVPAAIMSILLNSLVFHAIRRSSSIRLPSKLLLCTLIITDLGVGLFVQPQQIVFLIMKAKKPPDFNCFLVKISWYFGSLFWCVSLLTMTAISLDRYVALFHHLKYNQTMTVKRISLVLSYIWSNGAFFASTILWNLELWKYLTFTWTFICPMVISVAYIKIYRELSRRHGHRVQDRVQGQQQSGNTRNVSRYRRSASAMLWIYAMFLLCYVPGIFVNIIIISLVPPTALTHCIAEFFFTVLLLNSCLNPFVYCLRVPEIRAEVLKQLRNLFCRQNPS